MPVKRYNGSNWEVISGVGLQGPAGNDGTAPLTTKGELLTRTASAVTALAVGSNDQVLTADSSTATGLKWANVAAGANWTLLNSGGTTLSGSQTVTVSGISGADKILVFIENMSANTNYANMGMRLNTDTANNYKNYGAAFAPSSTYSTGIFGQNSGAATNVINLTEAGSNNAPQQSGYVLISGCNTSGVKIINLAMGSNSGGGQSYLFNIGGGLYDSSSTISSVSLYVNTGTFDLGLFYVYVSA